MPNEYAWGLPSDVINVERTELRVVFLPTVTDSLEIFYLPRKIERFGT
jgi:hypothetical protein